MDNIDITMNKIDSEVSYFAFVLGYDLLQDRLKNSEYTNTCDTAYDNCVSLAKLFLKSEEYKNLKYSGYEMLEHWLRENEHIVSTYFGEIPLF